MVYLSEFDVETGLIGALAQDKGRELRAGYVATSPFPHVVLDDFLPPALLERALAEFPTDAGSAEEAYNRAQERAKVQYNPETLPAFTRSLFHTFNSLPFIRVVENITGISGLLPDPYFFGGGFHELRQGGHLSVHADFVRHQQLNLQRRINVLIYLNKDWRDEYGGQLELWDEAMTACQLSVVPHFNRCVIFNTDLDSNHGNPTPINHPNGVGRKAIALYYYTATWKPGMRDYTTQFRVRPGSQDRTDWRTMAVEFAMDLCPPLLLRAAAQAKRRLISAA